MRIPAFLIEHPVEAMIAGALLLALDLRTFRPPYRPSGAAQLPSPAKVAVM